jgi:hypothetical protein
MNGQENSQPQVSSDPSTNPSSNADWLLRHYELCMATAEANKDIYKQWVYFNYFIGRLLVRMDTDTQKILDAELEKLHKMEFEIDSTVENQDTQKRLKEDMWKNFMKSHKAYAYLTLARSGETTINETGNLDFSRLKYENIKQIITYAHHGREQAIKDAEEFIDEQPNKL